MGSGMGTPTIPHLGVLGDRVAACPELPGYSRPEHSFRTYLTLAPLCVKRHACIPFLQAKTCRSESAWRERNARPRPLRRGAAAYAVGAQIPMPNGALIAVRHLRGPYYMSTSCSGEIVPFGVRHGGCLLRPAEFALVDMGDAS